MANEPKVPYMMAPGYIAKVLDKIKQAQVPDRFTQDFLATKLGIGGGSAKPIIPFLKKIGFLGSDGSPTELYRRFRNQSEEGAAVAAAIKRGYGPLYEVNEYVHDVDEPKLKGIVKQVTGLEEDSQVAKSIVASFRALNGMANFDASMNGAAPADATSGTSANGNSPKRGPKVEDLTVIDGTGNGQRRPLNIGYTINLHLPATSDVAVFNAIFRALRETLLD